MLEWVDQCLFEDGSYRESSSGYDAGVLEEISKLEEKKSIGRK